MITKIPHEGPRVETGPIQFGDDWPGVFIRGDNALADAAMLEVALREISESDPHAFLVRGVVKSLIDTLRSCHIDNFRGEL